MIWIGIGVFIAAVGVGAVALLVASAVMGDFQGDVDGLHDMERF